MDFSTEYVAWSEYKYRDISPEAVDEALLRRDLSVLRLFGWDDRRHHFIRKLKPAMQWALVTGRMGGAMLLF